jgi:uncharacterized integral membrane protein
MPEEQHAVDAPDVAVPAQGSASQDHDPTLGEPPEAADYAPTEHEPDTQAPQVPAVKHPHRTWISGLWIAVGCFCVLLLFALLFVLQNNKSVDISYFGAHGHLPLGVALLLAAIIGGLLVGLAGAARILQLRHAARKRAKKQS